MLNKFSFSGSLQFVHIKMQHAPLSRTGQQATTAPLLQKLLGMLHTHTHTYPFNGPLSGTTQVSQYQKGKTNLDFTEARDSEWQWNPLGHMQLCTSLRTDNHARTSPLSFLTGRMPFLPPNQQRQSTEGKHAWHVKPKNNSIYL